MTRCLLLFPALVFVLCSCASPRVAPRFTQPSTTGIAQANKNATAAIKSAKKQAEKLSTENPKLSIQIGALQVNLDTALSSLDVSEAARTQLDAKLAAQTNMSNKLADDYDKAAAKITAQDKIIKEVNGAWGLGAFIYGFKVLTKHLLILAAVIVVLLIAAWVLSLFFPLVGVGLTFVFGAISSIINRIRGKP